MKGSSRVEAAVKSRKTLEQVIAARPTREFDEAWGKFRKPEQFAEILYYGHAPRKKVMEMGSDPIFPFRRM